MQGVGFKGVVHTEERWRLAGSIVTSSDNICFGTCGGHGLWGAQPHPWAVILSPLSVGRYMVPKREAGSVAAEEMQRDLDWTRKGTREKRLSFLIFNGCHRFKWDRNNWPF
ncbi:hypothetical protein COCNU_04G013420 [Cocos nucifera]|uniref:Uncharacterized protein n=1 Tax=Cocos nucifera TaxID=13894 RepID=A0A8K0N0X8_COCNU|nr:hypothetical protein COCNU_04G013420 [Cocos nucifera]